VLSCRDKKGPKETLLELSVEALPLVHHRGGRLARPAGSNRLPNKSLKKSPGPPMARLPHGCALATAVPCGVPLASLDRGCTSCELSVACPAGYVRARRAGEAPASMRFKREVASESLESAFFASFLCAKRKEVARRGEIPARCKEPWAIPASRAQQDG
ncbi:hypothetical protein AACH10_20315, partial [Ideonella sp. DXS22W]